MRSTAEIQNEIDAIHNLGIPLSPLANIERNTVLAIMQVDLLARERALMWVLGKDPKTIKEMYANTIESGKKSGLIP